MPQPGHLPAWWRIGAAAGTPQVSPAEAMKVDELSRKVSAADVPDELAGTAVGCAECHRLNPESHQDTFDHEGESVHVVVTPKDCSVCHTDEARQYDRNKMAWARPNLTDNPLYQDLVRVVNGGWKFDGEKLSAAPHGRNDRRRLLFLLPRDQSRSRGPAHRGIGPGRRRGPRTFRLAQYGRGPVQSGRQPWVLRGLPYPPPFPPSKRPASRPPVPSAIKARTRRPIRSIRSANTGICTPPTTTIGISKPSPGWSAGILPRPPAPPAHISLTG